MLKQHSAGEKVRTVNIMHVVLFEDMGHKSTNVSQIAQNKNVFA